jgi:hypothetical protein
MTKLRQQSASSRVSQVSVWSRAGWARAGAVAASLFLLVTPSASAQSSAGATGRILGQVLDAASGQPLPGAQVVLGEGPRGVVAGIEGRFQIDQIPAGSASVRVLLIGFATRTVSEIQITAGGVTRVDVLLERSAVQVTGITVAADVERGSATALLNEQRVADGVTNAISAEQISRSPDGDAAAAVKRVSGVTVQDGKYVFVRGLGERYTTSSLNGARIPSPEPERKIVPLDLFPSGLLQAITTSKTFTPDQPGDFSGGNVNIRTPNFPARTSVSFSMSTGFNPDLAGQTRLRAPTAGGEWRAASTGPRALPAPAANYSGTVVRGSEVNQIINSFRRVWSVEETAPPLPLSIGASAGGSTGFFGQTLGYLGSLTWGRSEDAKLDQYRARPSTGGTVRDAYDGESGTSSVLLGGLLNTSLLLGSHSQIHLSNTLNRSADNTARRETGMDENTGARVQVERLAYVERWVRAHQLRGEHQISPRQRFDWNVNLSAVQRSEPDRSEFVTWLDPAVPIWFNDFEGAVRTYGSLDESANEFGVNYELSWGSLGSGQRIKVGALRRTASRDANSVGFRIQPFEYSDRDVRWQARPEDFFDGRYAQGDQGIFILSREISGGSYDARDELLAGFIMAEASLFDRVRLIGGVRVETYDLEVNAENQIGQPASTTRAYTDVLPALSAVVSLTDRQQLRFAASQTLARPEYRELAPITYREVLGGEQVIGNLDLERTLIQNLDARWEWYPTPGDVVSIGVFAKWFDAPIEQRYLARSGTDSRTFENAESATNRGIEFEVSSGLGTRFPSLEPLSVFANVTVMESLVRTGNPGDTERAMVGQAPWVINAGGTWTSGGRGVSSTLLYNVVGERIVNARASGALVDDVVERPRHVLDLSVRFPVRGSISGKVDLKNLLDAPYEVVQGSTVRESHRVGRSLSAGLSWRW